MFSYDPLYLCDSLSVTFPLNRLSYDAQCQHLNIFFAIEKWRFVLSIVKYCIDYTLDYFDTKHVTHLHIVHNFLNKSHCVLLSPEYKSKNGIEIPNIHS